MKPDAKQIITEALEKYKPVKILLLFSGGHDSICSTHRSAMILNAMGLQYEIYHGNTGTGCPETFDYVKMICDKYKWKLNVGFPPKGCEMDDIVIRWGFPKSTRQGHNMCYIRLKERAIRTFVTHKCKSSVYARENVLLLAGVRQSESVIRMGYTEYTYKDNSRVWCNPCFYWEQSDVDEYMRTYFIPRNPIKDAMCISGECLCGAFDSKERLSELKKVSPKAHENILRLQVLARKHGKNDIWGGKSAPKPKKKANKAQLNMFMCVGCESKRITV